MPFATLNDLAAALTREALDHGTISLDETFLAPRVLALMQSDLPPVGAPVVLTADPSRIFIQNDVSGTPTLWIEDATTSTEDAKALLSVAGASVGVAIQQTTPVSTPPTYDLVLAITLPNDWTFGDSLPELWGLQPPGYLTTPNGQHLYFSSFSGAQPLPSFPSKPTADDPAATPLVTGLNYYADIGLSGVFQAAEALLGLGDVTFPLYGPVTPDAEQPEFDLRASPPGATPLHVGFLDLGVPFVGVKTTWVDPAKHPEPSPGEDVLREPLLPTARTATPAPAQPASPVVLFYVGADIEIDGVPIEVDAIFTDIEAKSVLLTVGAPPTQQLSIGTLATALLGTDEQTIKGSAGELETYLDAITLEAFDAQVSLEPSPAIQYVVAQIGTSPAWPIGAGTLDYTLDLTFTWATYFFTSTTTWSASFEALLTINPKLSFDVTVTVPELTISGTEHGSVELTLAELGDIFGLHVPPGLLDLTLANFSVALTVPGGKITSLSLDGDASLSIAPFGTPVLALENVHIALAADPSASQYTLNLDGTIVLGGALSLAGSTTISNVKGTDSVFTLHLVDETVCSMLNHLVHLVDPTFDVTLPWPWSRFLDISLDAFVLEVDLTSETVSLAYEREIDLDFLQLTKLALNYAKGAPTAKPPTPSGVTVTVEGTFLGEEFGEGKANPALGWDAMNGSPPSVPGSTSLLDLRYLGLGQHIGFSGTQPPTIEAVLTDLTNSVVPVQPGQLPAFGSKEGELSFQAGSGWLIGADLTVMGTVSIAAIFNDPKLYGVRIKLDGDKAGSFAGLSFEILYRKVTDTIGVYHIELQVPTAMRTLQFGEVSLTLPIVVLDIYTNGNFRIDLGFPNGLDFSNSFCLQVFPFLGYGGFYFALLDGATSSRVPQISNGTFHPVIEFGIGLSVGVGKTIDEGILSGGLSVTVVGIVEGVVAWFHPTDTSPSETYYSVHGTVAVTGHLFATIDFAIIQASIDVTAIISVTLTVESHQPIYIEASASVSVSVSVKIVFFTIHLSFSASISASFTIGSASPTPWKLGAGTAPSNSTALSMHRPALAALPAAHRRALRRALVGSTVTPIVDWPAIPVLPGAKQHVPLWAITAFTKGETDPAQAIVLLTAENSISPTASTPAECRVPWGDDPASAGFNVLMQAMLGWGVYVETHPAIVACTRTAGIATITTGRPHGIPAATTVTVSGVSDGSFDGSFTVREVLGSTSFTCAQAGPDASSAGGVASTTSVSADQLEDLRQALGCSETIAAAFDSTTLTNFLAANVVLDVTPTSEVSTGTGVAVFPMAPAITLTDSASLNVPFETFDTVDPAYQANVRLYFQSLQARFDATAGAGGDGTVSALAAAPGPTSMASVVFSQYFNMLMSHGVKAAIELLSALPYTTTGVMGISDVAAALGDPQLVEEPLRIVAPNQSAIVLQLGTLIDLPEVTHQVRLQDTPASIADNLMKMGARDPSGAPYTATSVLAANAGDHAIFNVGIPVSFDGLTYTTQPHDTLNLVASRLILRLGGPALVNAIPGLATEVQALLDLNKPDPPTVPGITDPSAPIPAGTAVNITQTASYIAVAGDTLTLVAAYFEGPATSAISASDFVALLLAANPGLAVTDPAAAQAPGTVLTIPALTRSTAVGDSAESIAVTLVAEPAAVQAALAAAPVSPQLLSPQAILTFPVHYMVATGDTLAGIAAKLDITLADLAGHAAATAGLFAAGASLTIDDIPAIDVPTLMTALLQQGEWNTAAGMVSRFLLSGLRLPDPSNPAFQNLTPAQLSDPEVLAGIVTKPLYALTGQQYPIAVSPPSSYEITLTKPATWVDWLTLGGSASMTYALTPGELTLLATIATAPLDPEIQTLSRLALFRMLPAQTALQRHIAWQAAQPPAGLIPAGPEVGNPSVWMFPDALVTAIAGTPAEAPLIYELATSARGAGDVTAPVARYAWATLVDLAVSRPQTDGNAASVANSYVIDGADDTGAALLDELYVAVSSGAKPELYLLYQLDPAGASRTGLASDVLDEAATYVLKANLTTLTASGAESLLAAADADPTGVYAANMSDDPAGFLALLWEASITRSGGFFLTYVNANGRAGLPGSAFGSGSTARLSLLAILDQPAGPGVLLPFHNCAAVGDNIDVSASTVFVEPVTHLVEAGDTLASVQAAFDAQWQAGLSVADVASVNADVPLLLALGTELSIPAQSAPYTILYGDTLNGIAARAGVSVEALAAANASAQILAPGARMQFAPGVLSPSTTVPPGTAGFEMVRTKPLDDESVGALFNLVAWSIATAGGFQASGDGLPTTPTDAGVDWSYSQAAAVAPFATTANGSTSPALPPAAANPYNGIGVPGGVRFPLALQDVYGNRQALLPPWSSVDVPVGYFDDVVGLAAWPSIGLIYNVVAPATIAFALTLDQERYVPSASVPVDAAIAAVKADLASYARIHYQLAQPDLAFALRSTLAVDAGGAPVAYPLSKTPFLAFARGAYVQLAAMSTLAAVELEAGGMSVSDVTASYGVTAAELLRANQSQLYEALFPGPLKVPATYTTVQDDTLATVAARVQGLTVQSVAELNADLPLDAGIALATAQRVQAAGASDTLAGIALAAHASVPGLATANQTRTDILRENTMLTVGTVSYTLVAGDSLESAAIAIGATVAALATANQYLSGLFVDGAELDVADVVVGPGHTLAQLAAVYGGGEGLDAFALANQYVLNAFAPATSLQVGWSSTIDGPLPSDTLLTFAQSNHVTVDQLAAANPGAGFAGSTTLEIPGALQQTETPRWCTYAAAPGDTIAAIAAKFGAQPADIVALNPDLPGLIASGQTLTDSTSGASVVTAVDDTFVSMCARFQSEHGVTVTPAHLAVDVAAQSGLLLAGGLWICPPMRGDAYGSHPTSSLAGLVKAYAIAGPEVLATANAATLGLIEKDVALALPGWPSTPPITTGPNETFNSLVNRLASAGIAKTVQTVAADVADVAGLIAPLASVGATPPPSPPGTQTIIQPAFSAPTFRIRVEVVTARNGEWIDPDFAGVASVGSAISAIPADPGQPGDSPLSLTPFAERLEAAIPGLAVAIGPPLAEGDPASASSVWGVNFGSGFGPQLTYDIAADAATYYALPPLSPALMAGPAPIAPYQSGNASPLGTPQTQSFQAVDLDAWLDRFLAAVDLFLSPAYAVPAYAADPADVLAVIQAKQELADAISKRVAPVLLTTPPPAGPQPSQPAAAERLRQALLQTLGSAASVSTLVQLPAAVGSPTSDPNSAPRLSGKLMPPDGLDPSGWPQSYSFSTAKLALTDPSSTATFLFSVKAPAQSSHVAVDCGYVVTDIELPDPGSTIGDYEGSTWLHLVIPTAVTPTATLEIPIPLRSYPSPVALVSQRAQQSVPEPVGAADLINWNFDFVYQHDDAGQDAVLVEVAFDPVSEDAHRTAPRDGIDLVAIFQNLAQFTAVAQPLSDDLAKLPLLAPGTTNPVTSGAVSAFATIAAGIGNAFKESTDLGVPYEPTSETFYYQLVKTTSDAAHPQLTQLVISAIDPLTGAPTPNPFPLWPSVWASWPGKQEVQLQPVGAATATQAIYAYPAGIFANTAVEHRLGFGWDGSTLSEPPVVASGDVALVAPQAFSFERVNALSQQSGRAGISIWRNWSLVTSATTNPVFVYQTPIARFPAFATALVFAANPIDIRVGNPPPSTLADALGTFFQQLVTAHNTWQPDDTLTIRLGAGYSHAVATSSSSAQLDSTVPLFLVPPADFYPAPNTATGRSADWDPTNSSSFVSQVAALAETWFADTAPAPGGAFVFDFTVYASAGQMQPLIRAAALRYTPAN